MRRLLESPRNCRASSSFSIRRMGDDRLHDRGFAQWKAGTLSDAALWHQCFFDPPETFDLPAASGSDSRGEGDDRTCVSLMRIRGAHFFLTFEKHQSTYAVSERGTA